TNAPAPVNCFDSTTTTSITTTTSTSSTTTSTILVASPPLAGLAQWVRADAGVSVDGSNNVLSWADQSGNGRDWAQAGGTVQLVPNAQNGLPVVRSSGSSDYLTTPAYFTGTQEAEVLVLIKSNRPGTEVNYAWAGFGNDPSVINHYPWYA